MFFLPQGANIQSKSSKETNPIQKFDKKISFPNLYDENPNQEHKNPPKHNLRIKIKEKRNLSFLEAMLKRVNRIWVKIACC